MPHSNEFNVSPVLLRVLFVTGSIAVASVLIAAGMIYRSRQNQDSQEAD